MSDLTSLQENKIKNIHTYFDYCYTNPSRDMFAWPEEFKGLLYREEPKEKSEFLERVLLLAAMLTLSPGGFSSDAIFIYILSNPFWVIGFGSTYWNHLPVNESYPISPVNINDALSQYIELLEPVAEKLQKLITVKLNANQFAALLASTYLLGFKSETNKNLLTLINSGADMQEISKKLTLREIILFTLPIKE